MPQMHRAALDEKLKDLADLVRLGAQQQLTCVTDWHPNSTLLQTSLFPSAAMPLSLIPAFILQD